MKQKTPFIYEKASSIETHKILLSLKYKIGKPTNILNKMKWKEMIKKI